MAHPHTGGSSQGHQRSYAAELAPGPEHLRLRKNRIPSEIRSSSGTPVPETEAGTQDKDHPNSLPLRRSRRLAPLMEFATALLLHLQAIMAVSHGVLAGVWPVLERPRDVLAAAGPFFQLAVLVVAPLFAFRVYHLQTLKSSESAQPARIMRRARIDWILAPSTALAFVYVGLTASYFAAWLHEASATAKIPLLVALLLVFVVLWILIRHELVMLALDHGHPRLRGLKRCNANAGCRVYNAGSGGHTAELLHMLTESRPASNTHRIWVTTEGDEQSRRKILAWEALQKQGTSDDSGCTMVVVRRARKVHQSWLTVPFTALLSAYDFYKVIAADYSYWREAARAVVRGYPQVIVTNGPGTGFVMAAVVWAMKIFGLIPLRSCQVLFIESFARIKTLSLTGKLFYYSGLAARFIVQHAVVANRYGLELIPGLSVATAGTEESPRVDPFAEFDDEVN